MGTVTMTIEDDVEKIFREKAMQKYGKRKGSLGRAATQAMGQWAENESDDPVEEALRLLKKGFKMGKLRFKSRDELHER